MADVYGKSGIRGGKPHTGNSDGTGGRSKGSASAETLVQSGVTQKTRITEKPEELGMCTEGMSEKPQGTAKHGISTDRGNFKFR